MLWIRVAQALTMRGWVLSASFGQHLLDLRDRGGACGFQRIARIIEAELGQKLDEVFDYFEELPFSATTVSQLHRARLRSGQT